MELVNIFNLLKFQWFNVLYISVREFKPIFYFLSPCSITRHISQIIRRMTVGGPDLENVFWMNCRVVLCENHLYTLFGDETSRQTASYRQRAQSIGSSGAFRHLMPFLCLTKSWFKFDRDRIFSSISFFSLS